MKKSIILILTGLILSFTGQTAYALDAEQCGKPRGRFTNLSFAYSHINQDGYPKLHSDMGFSFTKGTTYYLHRPIAGFLRFGIDVSWFDVTYDNYKVRQHFQYDTDEYSIHHVDLGLQVGPSVTVNFFKRLQATAYFRYNPTLALMYNDDELQAGYANMFTGGVCVSYGFIGLGIETRYGKSKMKSYFENDDFLDSDSEDWTDVIGSRKVNTKFSGLRAYVSFRF